MRASKVLLSLFMIVLCLISLNVGSVNAADQICFKLALYPPYPAGDGPIILKLGIMDYGNGHFTLSGTNNSYVMPGYPPVFVGLIRGNAEIVNGKVEVSLNGSTMFNDNSAAVIYFYHLRLDPATLNGVYTATLDNIKYQNGPVSVVSCSGW